MSEADPEANNQSPDTANNSKCPPFGVRSYLTQFYNNKLQNFKVTSNTIFEDPAEEYALLLKPKNKGNKYCRPILWKAAIWIGINFLIFGMIGIMVAYLVPKRVVFMIGENHQYIVNEQAGIFNHNLEIVKLVGLLFFCIGGILTVIGLLVPTLLWRHCFDARRLDDETIDAASTNNVTNNKKDSLAISALPKESTDVNVKLDKVQPESISK